MSEAPSGLPTVYGRPLEPRVAVLLIEHPDAVQNGVWLVSEGPWTRPEALAGPKAPVRHVLRGAELAVGHEEGGTHR